MLVMCLTWSYKRKARNMQMMQYKKPKISVRMDAEITHLNFENSSKSSQQKNEDEEFEDNMYDNAYANVEL